VFAPGADAPGLIDCQGEVVHAVEASVPRRIPAKVRQEPWVPCDSILMEAATPLPQSRVRVLGDRLRVDGLVVGDQCAVRLVAERTEAGEDPAAVVTDAIEIGARVLDREQTGVQADFVKAEFERAARSVESSFADQAHATRELRRVTGHTPARLRAALRQDRDGDATVRLAAAFVRGYAG